MTELEKIFHEIHEGWSETLQGSLLASTDPTFERLEKGCVAYLRYKGFSVKAPLGYPHKVKNLDGLINFFYGVYKKCFSGNLTPYRNEQQDRKIAKEFVEKRQNADGLSREEALAQCATIIQTVFENINEFNFTIPVTFGIFGQQKMGWVTSAAIGIMNEKLARANEVRSQQIVDQMMIKMEQEDNLGWGEKILDELLKEKEDAKKEEN